MAEPARLLPMPSAPSGRSLPGLSLVKAPPDSQVGTPVRVLAVVLIVGALLFAVKVFVLGGGEQVPLDAASLSVQHVPKTPAPAKATTPETPPAKAPAAPETSPATPPAADAVKTAVDPAAAVAAAEQTAAAATARITAPNTTAAAVDPTAAAAATAPTAAPAPAGPEINPGLPKPLAAALRRNEVVVVGLYSPDSAVAELAWREAVAGAKSSGAGFVAVDVHQEALAMPLTALLGVMSDPSLIVFHRPGKVFVRIDGYVDRETVAQAVANAKVAE